MSGEIERRRHGETVRRLPPLPVSRVTEHIEEDLAYRTEFTVMKGKDIAARLSDGVSELHQDNAASRGDDPVLAQFHHRIEATFLVAGCEGLAFYMEHTGK
ncbi:MAG TPA: hypothetical protein VGA04_27415 [Streptosporangiaceae bacterium]